MEKATEKFIIFFSEVNELKPRTYKRITSFHGFGFKSVASLEEFQAIPEDPNNLIVLTPAFSYLFEDLSKTIKSEQILNISLAANLKITTKNETNALQLNVSNVDGLTPCFYAFVLHFLVNQESNFSTQTLFHWGQANWKTKIDHKKHSHCIKSILEPTQWFPKQGNHKLLEKDINSIFREKELIQNLEECQTFSDKKYFGIFFELDISNLDENIIKSFIDFSKTWQSGCSIVHLNEFKILEVNILSEHISSSSSFRCQLHSGLHQLEQYSKKKLLNKKTG